MELLVLSIGRGILKAGSRDHARLKLYAEALDNLHVIVLTRTEHGFGKDPIHDGNLHIYPTHSRTRVGMLYDAFAIGVRILGERKMPITSQDPLELGCVAYLLAKRFSIPFNVQAHGDYLGTLWVKESPLNHFRLRIMKWILERADSVRVVSLRIKKSFLQIGIDESKIRLLPIRPELERFVGAERKQAASFTILTASRFAPEKNIPRLIRSFAFALPNLGDSTLRIIGTGPCEVELKQLASECGVNDRVAFVPWTESIETEMAAADLFVLASKHEAYALVLIEALATGTPVVTTDVGCVGDVVRDGVHGIVVQDGSDTAYAEALIRIRHDSVFRMQAGEAGTALGKKLLETTPHAYAKEWVVAHTA